MRKIKIGFADFWEGFDVYDNFIVDALLANYDLDIPSQPDYLFYSLFGNSHLEYSCIKIFFSGENISPDFSECDYAIGSDYIEFGNRYLRYPLYVTYKAFDNLEHRQFPSDEMLLDREFCSFVVSNSKYADPIREAFFFELSKYKTIASGGRLYNNVGGAVADKLDFISRYKFNIAFENSAYDGYTTEKIVEPFSVNTLPLYWGNPLVKRDFNENAFVDISSFSSIVDAASYVIELDKNDVLYLKALKAHCLTIENTYLKRKKELISFLSSIIGKDVAEAKILPQYGFSKFYSDKKLQTQHVLNKLIRVKNAFAKKKK